MPSSELLAVSEAAAISNLMQRLTLVESRLLTPKREEPAAASGGGGPGPTVMVAASDASDASKARADYQCDGSDDEVQIQAAYDDTGGRVLLSEGTFSVSPGTGFTTVGLSGAGPLLTIIEADASSAGYLAQMVNHNCVIEGISFDANSHSADIDGVRAYAHQTKIVNCRFKDFHGNGIDYGGWDKGMVLGCVFEDNDGAGIHWTSAFQVIVANNYFDAASSVTGKGIDTDSSGGDNHIVGNIFGDYLDYGIYLDGDDATAIIANQFRTAGTDGVHLTSNCTDCFVVVNNFRNMGGATPINDNGTGTQLTMPGDATYGDNWT